MKNCFSAKQVEVIKDIVKMELRDEKTQGCSVWKSFGWLVLGIVCSLLTFVFMPSLLSKGASKIFKIKCSKGCCKSK